MALLKNMSKILKNPAISLYTSITSETSPHFTTQKLCNNELQPPPYSKDELKIISSLEQLKQSIDISQQFSQIKTITTIFTPKSKSDALFDEIYRKLAKTFDFTVRTEYQETANIKGNELSNIDKFLHNLIEEKQHFTMTSIVVSFITMVNVYICSISGSDTTCEVINDNNNNISNDNSNNDVINEGDVDDDNDDDYYVYNEHPSQSNVVPINEDIFVELYEKYLVICNNSIIIEKEFCVELNEYFNAFNTKFNVKDVFVEIYWETVFKNKDINELFVKCFYKQLTLDDKIKESVNNIINVLLKGIVALKKEITQNLNVYEIVAVSKVELADVIAFHKKTIDNNNSSNNNNIKDDNNSVQVTSEGGSECNYECEEIESNINVNVKINNNNINNKAESVNEIVRFQSYNVLLDESVNTNNSNNNNKENTVGIVNCIDNIVLDSVVDETNISNNYLDCCLFDNNNNNNNNGSNSNVNEVISENTIKEDVCKCNNGNDDVIKDTRTIEDIINEINTVNGYVRKGSVKKKNKKKHKKRKVSFNKNKDNCNGVNGDRGRGCDKNGKDNSCFDNVVDLFKHAINREQVFAWQTQKINPRISSQWIKEISLKS